MTAKIDYGQDIKVGRQPGLIIPTLPDDDAGPDFYGLFVFNSL